MITTDASTNSSREREDAPDDSFAADYSRVILHFSNEAELSDLIRDVWLSKSKAELLLELQRLV